MELTILSIIGIFIGIAIGYYWGKAVAPNGNNNLQAELIAVKSRAEATEKSKDAELVRVMNERNKAQVDLSAADKLLATVEESKASAERSLKSLFDLKEEIELKMREAFASASQSQLTLGRADLLSAAEEKFAPFRNQLEELKRSNNELKGSIANSSEQSAKVADEARKLAEAMTSTNKQGSWGELQLGRVVELTGMLEHIDFETQETKAGEDGNLRPDLVVKLPGGKQIIVDAKAPTKNYIEAQIATTEAERTRLLQEFTSKVEGHAKKLGTKEYWKQYKPAPEFVILFLPNEALFSTALSFNSNLIEYAWGQKVVIATPTTLLSILRTIAHSWQQVDVEKRAEKVIELATNIHAGIQTVAESFETTKKALENATKAHQKTFDTLDRKVYKNAEKLVGEGKKLMDERKSSAGDTIDIQSQVEIGEGDTPDSLAEKN